MIAAVMSTEISRPEERATELRAAVRFPLSVAVTLATEDGEISAQTVNISANGVLFDVARQVRVASQVRFTIPMPREAMGTPTDVVVNCAGRVVRCAQSKIGLQLAAVIDKYYFSH